MHREPRRGLLAVLKQADERVRVQRRLAAGQAERPGALREQADHFLSPVEQPGVVAVLRRLGAHQAVVVALLGEQQGIVPGGVLPQHGDPAAVVGDVDDVTRVQVRQLRPEPEHRAGHAGCPGAARPGRPRHRGLVSGDEVEAVPGGCVLPVPQQARNGRGGTFLGGAAAVAVCIFGQADPPYMVGHRWPARWRRRGPPASA